MVPPPRVLLLLSSEKFCWSLILETVFYRFVIIRWRIEATKYNYAYKYRNVPLLNSLKRVQRGVTNYIPHRPSLICAQSFTAHADCFMAVDSRCCMYRALTIDRASTAPIYTYHTDRCFIQTTTTGAVYTDHNDRCCIRTTPTELYTDHTDRAIYGPHWPVLYTDHTDRCFIRTTPTELYMDHTEIALHKT